MSNPTKVLLLATLAMLAAAPASANSVKFYSGTTGYTGVFNGAGSVYSNTFNQLSPVRAAALEVAAAPTSCPRRRATRRRRTSPPRPPPARFLADLSPDFAGLGVGNGSPSDDDKILNGDILTISSPPRSSSRASDVVRPQPQSVRRLQRRQITGAMGILINGVFHSLQDANFDALRSDWDWLVTRSPSNGPEWEPRLLRLRARLHEGCHHPDAAATGCSAVRHRARRVGHFGASPPQGWQRCVGAGLTRKNSGA